MADIVSFRARQMATPPIAYEPLAADAWAVSQEAARAILDVGWECPPHEPLKLQPPVEWDTITSGHRNWSYQLHAWDPIGRIIAAVDAEPNEELLRYATDLAADWLRQHPTPGDGGDFAWYDMAVGLRAYRLAYLLDRAARDPAYPDEFVAAMVKGITAHMDWLARDENFAGGSNHGVYQAAGQIAVGRRLAGLPGMREAAAQGEARLQAMIDSHFTSEGVHKEHSPEYHYMVCMSLRGVYRAGLIPGSWFRSRLRAIEEALAWFVLPNERIAMFGDSGHKLMRLKSLEGVTSEALRFVTSGGTEGSPPADTIRGFPESGYAVLRDRWPHGPSDLAECSYVAQIAAFHSRVHKHADDLSFIWYDHGTELLVDSGRYGYVGRTEPGSQLARDGFYYSDPYRVYVESTRAHNTVEIDGRSYDRRATPYGSGLRRFGEQNGVQYTECEVVQFDTVRHTRLLLFAPGEWLLVVDALQASDGPHRYVQRFHFAPELEADPTRAGRLILPGGQRLSVATFDDSQELVQHRGRSPDLLGWISRDHLEAAPLWTVGVTASPTEHAVFVTLLALAGDVQRHEEGAAWDAMATSGRVAWMVDGSSRRVAFSRVPGRSFSVAVAE